VELDAADQPAFWNLGIAATAIGDWETARRAWRGYGLQIPEGTGPISMDLGLTPIRLCPDNQGEVVWCHRSDPARARIESVPLAESGYGWRDVVLHDGEPRGYRFLQGDEVPVFDALQRLEASAYDTFEVILEGASPESAAALCQHLAEAGFGAEEWSSSVRLICRKCSEGRPHAQHDGAALSNSHRLGVAAPSAEDLEGTLTEWLRNHAACQVTRLAGVLVR
jgi:hypothetical protein